MPPPGYKMVFDEEFNGPLEIATVTGWGPIVSPIKWTAHTPYGGDFGDAYFTGPSENPTTPDPFSISNGFLSRHAARAAAALASRFLSERAVIKMTGVVERRAARLFIRSSPLIPGI